MAKPINLVKAKQEIPEESTINPIVFFIRVMLFVIALWSASEIATVFAPHLEHAQRWPLHIAFFLMVWLVPHIRLKPPVDILSRMRAIFRPKTKKIALTIALALHIASCAWTYLALQERWQAPALTMADLQSFENSARRSQHYQITDEIIDEQMHYRWPKDDQDPTQAPYLIPLKQFEGLVLAISDQKIKRIDHQWGILMKVRPWESNRFLNYRSELHLPLDVPLYLFELRAHPYFVLPQISVWICTLLLCLLFWGLPVRDDEIDSTLVYIPKDLRVHLLDLDQETMDTQPQDQTQDQSQDQSQDQQHEKDQI